MRAIWFATSRGSTSKSSAAPSGLGGFNIRGVGGNRVLTRIDGVPIAEEFEFGHFEVAPYALSLESVESVEILRGAASSLYGSDALGGVVSLVTRDPADYLSGQEGLYLGVHAGWDGRDRSASTAITWAASRADWQRIAVDRPRLRPRARQPGRPRRRRRFPDRAGSTGPPAPRPSRQDRPRPFTFERTRADARSARTPGRDSSSVLARNDEPRRDLRLRSRGHLPGRQAVRQTPATSNTAGASAWSSRSATPRSITCSGVCTLSPTGPIKTRASFASRRGAGVPSEHWQSARFSATA